MIPLIDRVAEIAPRYDAFIIDLWGVLHDGVAPYPGAIGCLRALAGKPVLLLSNAPRRAIATRGGLRKLGFADDLYTTILTSGEATWQALHDRADPWFAALGPRLYHLGPPRDRSVFEGLPVTLAAHPHAADVLLNTGPDDDRDPTDLNIFIPELQACLDAGLKMICANPDLHVIRGGTRILCAGALAEWYAAQGGEVRQIGKPYAAVYAQSLAMLGAPASRVLAIGDSLRTDIAGAQAAGIDSLWVLGGLHAAAINGSPAAARTLAESYGRRPTAMIERFA
jgi:HAD superfamily hydrolase (TIGR01459 family)